MTLKIAKSLENLQSISLVGASTLASLFLFASCATVAYDIPPNNPVTATRSFVGPNSLPPQEFAAYGLVAYADAPSSSSQRDLDICRAYLKALPDAQGVSAMHNIPPKDQMVTVWPLKDDEIANQVKSIQSIEHHRACVLATQNYSLFDGQKAVAEAGNILDSDRRGPFLIAWAPGHSKGRRGEAVLVADLSNVQTYDQAAPHFRRWRNRIQENPSLWSNGWSVEGVRLEISTWLDNTGENILGIFNT